MRKFAIGILIIIAAIMLTGAAFQRHALACELLPILNYQQIKNQVFVDAAIPEQQAEAIQKLIDLAPER